ncbi:MAG: TIGR00159 family protein [Nitrospirae bacterium]|nr:TIGR00159 family protein [Nitrospirota bacterium]MBI5695914.1 TIGR00159 family protein [Nitrospirota bacterium]
MLEFVKTIRPQDVVDILLVAFILYRLFLLIKGTRAVQMLAGLGVLLVALFLSRWMELYTVNWLVQSFMSQLVIVILVLFQPELRRALAHMGENPLFSSMSPVESSKFLDELVKASVSLANRRVGALMVLQRETDLRNIVEMGTELESRVSRELLLSIFHPTSPLHDGAVIIRRGRLAAAGCFLPLTTSTQVNKALGTRHRAAIGLSEETDAVVIVISEETGTISVVTGGTLTRDLDAVSLRRMLTRIFVTQKKSSGKDKASAKAG